MTHANLAKLEPISPARLISDLEEINRGLTDDKQINVELTVRKALMLNYQQSNVTRGERSGRIFSTINHGGSKQLIPYLKVGSEKVSNNYQRCLFAAG